MRIETGRAGPALEPVGTAVPTPRLRCEALGFRVYVTSLDSICNKKKRDYNQKRKQCIPIGGRMSHRSGCLATKKSAAAASNGITTGQ